MEQTNPLSLQEADGAGGAHMDWMALHGQQAAEQEVEQEVEQTPPRTRTEAALLNQRGAGVLSQGRVRPTPASAVQLDAATQAATVPTHPDACQNLTLSVASS